MTAAISTDNIFLVGYRCTGKTSLARDVAQKIGWDFIDADEALMNASRETVSKIVARGGWPLFRKLERETLIRICSRRRQVVATGGGVVSDLRNIHLMKENGLVVWLKATPETIFERMNHDPQTGRLRPALTTQTLKAEIEETLRERIPLYKMAMTAEIDTEGKTLVEISGEITSLVEGFGIQRST